MCLRRPGGEWWSAAAWLMGLSDRGPGRGLPLLLLEQVDMGDG